MTNYCPGWGGGKREETPVGEDSLLAIANPKSHLPKSFTRVDLHFPPIFTGPAGTELGLEI